MKPAPIKTAIVPNIESHIIKGAIHLIKNIKINAITTAKPAPANK
jgi:hypothetical protein